jgi:hypothetical protein
MVGHLQHFFAKMTNARQTPGGGWAAMELIETLHLPEKYNYINNNNNDFITVFPCM